MFVTYSAALARRLSFALPVLFLYRLYRVNGYRKNFCFYDLSFVIILLSLPYQKNQPKNMLVKIYGSAVFGVEATTITIEVYIDKGVGYYLVGLPDVAIKESNYRIAAALQNNGYKIPGRKITINMAPADMRKEGSAYDLSFAIGILAANEQIQADDLDKYIIMGELSLDGGLQPIKGALPIAIQARKEGFKGFILPAQNAKEAAIVDQLEVYGVENIKDVIAFFNGERQLERTIVDTRKHCFPRPRRPYKNDIVSSSRRYFHTAFYSFLSFNISKIKFRKL